jgi:endonuclease YncB( thermonuclease family)
MPKPLVPDPYDQLLGDISRLYEDAQKTQTNAQVQFCWQVGRKIVLFDQKGQARAPRNKELLARLSADLTRKYGAGFSVDNLERMRRLFLAYPYSAPARNMSWTNYAELLKVPDAKKRERLASKIEREGLSKREVRQLVRTPRPSASLPPLKRPTDLKLNTYCKSALNVKLPDGAVLVDCGFFMNRVMTKAELAQVDLTDTPSYTYAATVDRVVDGDTLKVIIDVGFGNRVYDKLRLRGVNTPELGTPEGEKAKRYVAGLLPPGSCVVLKSHKSGVDKYGRFVVDVFYCKGSDDPQDAISNGVYLNQQLLDEGFAVRMEG